MIRLNVKEYCHNCQDFEPETNVVAYYGNRKKFLTPKYRVKIDVDARILKIT